MRTCVRIERAFMGVQVNHNLTDEENELLQHVSTAREDLRKLMVEHEKAGHGQVTVTACTFAAPRVGDRPYAQRCSGPSTRCI